MDNKTIAKYFDQIAKLMELHQQNPFKIRTYANAYQSIARSDQQLIGLDLAALIAVPGIGKTLAQNIIELKEKGTITVLDQLIAMTPPGILDVLKIKGLGAKKIAQIWNELAVESLGELEYACLENRLVGLKGFGEKTQTDILNQIDFLRNSKGAVLLPVGMEYGENVLKLFRQLFPHSRFEITGSLKRKMEVVRQIDIAGTIESEHLYEKIDDLDDFS
ncbi:MAG TPA: helix-hairpin-helix domain-containing protein, partial [Saprospiraceae bacterium]|nr:helix-hairpin-helix domain-containing protein [Saprospiraceae bacterium]